MSYAFIGCQLVTLIIGWSGSITEDATFDQPTLGRLSSMAQYRYQKRTFLAPVSSLTTSYIVAEVQSSYNGTYELGTNMLTIADCHRSVNIEFFLGNRRERRQSLAKAQLLADVINTFCEQLREEAKLIEQHEKRPRKRETKK